MLRVRAQDANRHLTACPVLGEGLRPHQVVLGHVVPRIVEATVVPSLIFYAAWHTIGVGGALAGALLWSGLVAVRRVVRTRRVPVLVLLGAVGLTARTAVTVVSGSTFFYFLQPIVVTALIALLFFGSVVIGRPLVRRLAAEFCPLAPEVSSRHTMQRFFRSLTVLWGSVLLTNAAVTLVILLTLSANTFVATKTVFTPSLTIAAATVTVAWAVRVAHREGIGSDAGVTAVLQAST